jgi:hypothetical protein
MDKEENDVHHDGAAIVGQTEGPLRSDGVTEEVSLKDNRNNEVMENSTSGLDSVDVRGGQDGRNNRAMGSQDMDGQNGILRMNDQDNSTMEVTDEAQASIAASAAQTGTSTVGVTTSVTTSGPDDYASADEVGVPNAQQEAKASLDGDNSDDDLLPDNEGDEPEAADQEEVAETGTDINHQPTY